MKTYLKQNSVALFREKRFVFRGEAPAKEPDEAGKVDLDRRDESSKQDWEQKLGTNNPEIRKYQFDYKLQDLRHKLGKEFIYNADAYNPAKLLAQLAGILEKSRNKYGDEKAAYDKKAALYLKNVEFNDEQGKVKLPPDQIALKGQAFAGLYEDLGQDEKRLLGSLDNRQLIESVMSKLETDTGGVSAVDRATRYEASLNFLQQQRAMMKASMEKLAGRKPLELVEGARAKLHNEAWKAIQEGFVNIVRNKSNAILRNKEKLLNSKDYLTTDEERAWRKANLDTANNYLKNFWNSLNQNEKAVLQYDNGKFVGDYELKGQNDGFPFRVQFDWSNPYIQELGAVPRPRQ